MDIQKNRKLTRGRSVGRSSNDKAKAKEPHNRNRRRSRTTVKKEVYSSPTDKFPMEASTPDKPELHIEKPPTEESSIVEYTNKVQAYIETVDFGHAPIIYSPVFDEIMRSHSLDECESGVSSVPASACESNIDLKEFSQSSSEVLRTFNFWASSTNTANEKPTASDIIQSRADKICSYQMNPILAARALSKPSKAGLLKEFLDGLGHIDCVPLTCTEDMFTVLFNKLLPEPTSVWEQAVVDSFGGTSNDAYSITDHHGWLSEEYIKKILKELEERKNHEKGKSTNNSILNNLSTTIKSAIGYCLVGSLAHSLWMEDEEECCNKNRPIKEAPTRAPPAPIPVSTITTAGDEGKVGIESTSISLPRNETFAEPQKNYPKRFNVHALAGIYPLPPRLRDKIIPGNTYAGRKFVKKENGGTAANILSRVEASQQSVSRNPARRVEKQGKSEKLEDASASEKEMEFLLPPRKNVGVEICTGEGHHGHYKIQDEVEVEEMVTKISEK